MKAAKHWMVAGVLVFLLGTACVFLLPKQYEATTRISIDAEIQGVTRCWAQDPPYTIHDPAHLEAQLAYLKSKVVLNAVAARFNLAVEWGKTGARLERDAVYRILANSTRVSHDPETSLLVITVRRPDPDDAARIANEIATVYQEARRAEATHAIRVPIDQMMETLKRQRAHVERAEEKVGQLGEQGLEDSEPYRRALDELSGERQFYFQLEARSRQAVESIRVPDPVEIIEIAEPSHRPSNTLQSLALGGIPAVFGIVLAVSAARSTMAGCGNGRRGWKDA